MKVEKMPVNQACILAGAFLLIVSVMLFMALFYLMGNTVAIWCVVLFLFLVLTCVVLLLAFIRYKLIFFSNSLCGLLDDMLAGNIEPPPMIEEESLLYKINHRLVRLYEIMQKDRHNIARERADLQELISDISHQVKTPITNLKMVNTMLLQQTVSEEKQQEFLSAMQNQLNQLDFLMQAMIKTSRLETGVLTLEKKQQPIYDTLAAALGGIVLYAEQKQITVTVDCAESIVVPHDAKWTSEALFNILDNAVKYTPNGGCITVQVFAWEMYLKIDIMDTGMGIAEEEQGAIFQRFYRTTEVHQLEGIGIGLYLAREIITKQGGYICVSSAVGQGATFSVFLPWT